MTCKSIFGRAWLDIGKRSKKCDPHGFIPITTKFDWHGLITGWCPCIVQWIFIDGYVPLIFFRDYSANMGLNWAEYNWNEYTFLRISNGMFVVARSIELPMNTITSIILNYRWSLNSSRNIHIHSTSQSHYLITAPNAIAMFGLRSVSNK